MKHEGLFRQREVTPHDAEAILFNSNDYLSLGSDPSIKKAYTEGFAHYAVNSGGSMLVCGYQEPHKALENAFAKALNVDDCLLFPSGYAANLSIVRLLAAFNATFFIDKQIHASFYDGLESSGATFKRYQHLNLDDLAVKLQSASSPGVVITEGIFSMSGQGAPLGEMAQLCQAQHLDMVVDEAHSFGLLGEQGLGAVIHHQLTQKEVPLRIIPLGKAMAASGAIVAGDGVWIDALQQKARSHIYSTGLSPALAHGMLHAFDVVRAADDRRKKLSELVDYFRQFIRQSPLVWRDSHSPIQQLQVGCPNKALAIAKKLREQSIICTPIRQPTVSRSETGLRIILNYHHQPEHIDALFTGLHES